MQSKPSQQTRYTLAYKRVLCAIYL